MPVPEKQESSPQPPAAPAGQPSQKSMTKAERRELQEKQRAAKAAAKAQAPPGGGGAGAKAKGSQPLPKKAGDAVPAKQSVSTSKDGLIHVASDDATRKKGPRIFTHFGLPKPLGHTVKGDIHPAVVRLGLSFSEFKICGANARCIATLTAFKNVWSLSLSLFVPVLNVPRSFKITRLLLKTRFLDIS